MIKNRNIRFLTMAFTACVFLTASSVLAKGGDDDKKGKKKRKDGIVLQDSAQYDILKTVDLEVAAVDDTLVFEDWDNPGDLGGDDGIGIGGIANGGKAIDKNGNGYNYQDGTAPDLSFNSVYNSLKKEYRVEFNIYPNPTMERLNINPEVTPMAIRIADIGGREHKTLDYVNQVNVSDLPIGTYFIQLIYPDHVEARKFIKR